MQFTKARGLIFTDSVARVRAEVARRQITRAQCPYGEVVYEEGFTRSWQFNRIFKRVFGQSSSQFRASRSSDKTGSNAAQEAVPGQETPLFSQ
jgi:AraC-like DNA-binding protein